MGSIFLLDGEDLSLRWSLVLRMKHSSLKTAIQSMVLLANHELVETDPELGSNAVFFLFILG